MNREYEELMADYEALRAAVLECTNFDPEESGCFITVGRKLFEQAWKLAENPGGMNVIDCTDLIVALARRLEHDYFLLIKEILALSKIKRDNANFDVALNNLIERAKEKL